MEYSRAVAEVEADFLAHIQRSGENFALNLSEADTRVHLVDPVLRILGYAGVRDMRREVPIPATREFVDYELLIDGQPLALVEAKAVRHSITDQDAGQCVQYASVLGVPWCIITNGAVWQIYYAYAVGPLVAKKVAQVHVDGDEESVAEAWRVLSLIARDSLMQTNPLTRLLVERVVSDELSRADSAAVLALRKAVRDRFREQVPAQAVLEAINRSKLIPPSKVAPTPGLPDGVPSGRPLRRGPSRKSPGQPTSLLLLVEAGLLPPDATLECRLYGVSHAARLREGKIDLNGTLYDTPSAAAAALRDGKASNGWVIWKYKGEFLADLRARASSASAVKPGLA